MTAAVLAVAVLAVAIAAAWATTMIRRHGAGPVIWRWLSGHNLDGVHRTNATWTQPATKVLHPTGHGVRWHHLPRLHRAGIRTGTTLLVLLAATGLVAAPVVTLIALATAAAALVALAVWKTVRAALAFRFRYRWVRPLHRALTPALGVPPAALQVAPDRSKVRSEEHTSE